MDVLGGVCRWLTLTRATALAGLAWLACTLGAVGHPLLHVRTALLELGLGLRAHRLDVLRDYG